MEILVHGKSTVCKLISKIADAKIIDADEIAKNMDYPNSEYVTEISKLFGDKVLDTIGSLNRKKLANLIFNNFDNKLELDKITFKFVVQEILRIIEKCDETGEKIVLLDVPLLYESNLNKKCDIVISVVASTNNKLERIKVRDKIDDKTAKLRLSIQKDDDFYYRNSDIVIENNGNLELLQKNIERILLKFKIK
ncbi:MAG: dephospho-CoA kinase [Clostridia bacterium]|nr:dephospho-CoA kinase [Clostridia bacterium]